MKLPSGFTKRVSGDLHYEDGSPVGVTWGVVPNLGRDVGTQASSLDATSVDLRTSRKKKSDIYDPPISRAHSVHEVSTGKNFESLRTENKPSSDHRSHTDPQIHMLVIR